MFEQDKIKQALELGNHKARMLARLKSGDFRGVQISDIKNLDPRIQERIREGAYRQMLSLAGVDYIGY